MSYTVIRGEEWIVQTSPKYKTKKAAEVDAAILREKGYRVRIDSITKKGATTGKTVKWHFLVKRKKDSK